MLFLYYVIVKRTWGSEKYSPWTSTSVVDPKKKKKLGAKGQNFYLFTEREFLKDRSF
jgi:hypothetical protein